MPRSQQPDEGTNIIIKEIENNTSYKTVLDVGCGDGKWSELLSHLDITLDGVEVWEPYVSKFNLRSKYNVLYNMNILDVNTDTLKGYDALIFGDILEHIQYDDAIKLVERIKEVNVPMYLSIPISVCIQDGRVYGNPFETHVYQWKQDELEQLGFKLLHKGTNENGLVWIGTFVLNK